jgi:hypothetical protein
MPIKAAIAVLAMLMIASCAGDDPGKGAANMALACQTTPCKCVSEDSSLLRKAKTTEILWKSNGDAHCPKGFNLEKAAKE